MVTRPAWAEILRALREAAGVTQEGWAGQLGLGRTTLQRWERGELPPAAHAEAALLADARLGGAGAPAVAAPSVTQPGSAPSHNLPATLTSFVGRQREVADV